SYRYLSGRRGELEEFYLLTLLATLGAMVMVAATHFAAFVLGLEILSISLYAMIAYPEERRPPLEAAFKYLVLSAVASTTMLFGMALAYSATGSLYFADLSDPAGAAHAAHLLTGQLLLFAGLAFKLSLVPFHLWTPDVYQGAPAPVGGFIATVSKVAVFALLLRLSTAGDSLATPAAFLVVMALAVTSMLVGNLLALLQDNLKRILAYSSVAHMGYLLIALLALARLPEATFAAEAAFIYLAGYVATTLTAFGVIAALSSAAGGEDAEAVAGYRGLFWRRPLLAACLTTALLSLMGLPLTAGFIGKFYLLAIGAQGALWLLLWALIVGSAVGIYYYLKVIYAMTSQAAGEADAHLRETGVERTLLVTLAVTVIALGVYPTSLINTARALLGGFGL
ncbi:MAG: NADH-quinone oxidoreductase subunit N, partial [Pseudomonadota bacterium]